MPEFREQAPDAKAETLEAVAFRMRAREDAINALFHEALEAQQEWDQASPDTRAEKKAIFDAARRNLSDAFKKHTELLKTEGVNIKIPDTKFTIDLIFPTSKGDKEMTGRFSTFSPESLPALLGEMRGWISMEGLHNFGCYPKNYLGMDEVAYQLVGDKGFAISGNLFVDQSGHIVRDLSRF